jgi:hypothetical protein
MTSMSLQTPVTEIKDIAPPAHFQGTAGVIRMVYVRTCGVK